MGVCEFSVYQKDEKQVDWGNERIAIDYRIRKKISHTWF